MADGQRSIHLVTSDESLMSSARAASGPLEGWELVEARGVDELRANDPVPGDLILLDGWFGPEGENVYETCRRLTGTTRCRTYVVGGSDVDLAQPIALFCGATGVLTRPLTTAALRAAAASAQTPLPPLPSEARDRGRAEPVLPESLLKDLCGDSSTGIVSAITDPETRLFSYEYLTFKLDEEFKRAQRFGNPLACVMLGFEGQAGNEVLRMLSGIFLQFSRDTDVLGRFDETSFLFLLPHTGPDGAAVMAKRIREQVEKENLRDLVGDRLEIAVGISSYPHVEVHRREDLFGRARDAFHAAQREGGGVVQVS